MNKYTREQALDIVSRVIDLPHGDETYDVVHINGSMAVVHHHNNAESKYSHLRGVVIDLDDEVMITKSAFGAIAPVSIRDFKLTNGTLNRVLCGVEGTNLKVLKYKGTVYYVTNRRIYTEADKEKVLYVKYTMSILENNPSELFRADMDTAPYYHEFILVNRETSQLTTIHIPESGFLVYVGTRIIDEDEYKKQNCKPVVTTSEFTKLYGINVPITSRYVYTNRGSYTPVSTIYPTETLPSTMEGLCKYIQYSKEFCIVTYTDDSGKVSTIRVCHDEYLRREAVLQFSDNLLKRYIALCRGCPMDGARNRHQSINKYLKKHNIYRFEDAKSVLTLMKKGKSISTIHRNKFHYCKDSMNTERFIINTWIDMYSCLPPRNKHLVHDLYAKYISIVDTLESLMTRLIHEEEVDCPASVLQILNKKLDDIKYYSPKESAFETKADYQEQLLGYVRRNIIQYTRVSDLYSMGSDLGLV